MLSSSFLFSFIMQQRKSTRKGKETRPSSPPHDADPGPHLPEQDSSSDLDACEQIWTDELSDYISETRKRQEHVTRYFWGTVLVRLLTAFPFHVDVLPRNATPTPSCYFHVITRRKLKTFPNHLKHHPHCLHIHMKMISSLSVTSLTVRPTTTADSMQAPRMLRSSLSGKCLLRPNSKESRTKRDLSPWVAQIRRTTRTRPVPSWTPRQRRGNLTPMQMVWIPLKTLAGSNLSSSKAREDSSSAKPVKTVCPLHRNPRGSAPQRRRRLDLPSKSTMRQVHDPHPSWAMLLLLHQGIHHRILCQPPTCLSWTRKFLQCGRQRRLMIQHL